MRLAQDSSRLHQREYLPRSEVTKTYLRNFIPGQVDFLGPQAIETLSPVCKNSGNSLHESFLKRKTKNHQQTHEKENKKFRKGKTRGMCGGGPEEEGTGDIRHRGFVCLGIIRAVAASLLMS